MIQARELQTTDEYRRKFKHLQADKDAEIEALRVCNILDPCVRSLTSKCHVLRESGN